MEAKLGFHSHSYCPSRFEICRKVATSAFQNSVHHISVPFPPSLVSCRSPDEKKAVAAVADELGELKQIDPVELAGSRWRLVFTESTASSSGKIGPFIGRTEQVLP